MGLSVALALTSCGALAHSWYDGLVDPYGKMCCSGLDCRPVDMCRTRHGEPGVQINRLCVEIPWNRVLATPAPARTPAGIACGPSLRPSFAA